MVRTQNTLKHKWCKLGVVVPRDRDWAAAGTGSWIKTLVFVLEDIRMRDRHCLNFCVTLVVVDSPSVIVARSLEKLCRLRWCQSFIASDSAMRASAVAVAEGPQPDCWWGMTEMAVKRYSNENHVHSEIISVFFAVIFYPLAGMRGDEGEFVRTHEIEVGWHDILLQYQICKIRHYYSISKLKDTILLFDIVMC